MGLKDSREIVVEASAPEILGVIADLEAAPGWMPQYRSATILATDDNGRPKRAELVITAAGLTDTQVLEFSWRENGVRWSLVSATHMRSQNASYTLAGEGGRTTVRFEMEVDPVVPLPGFVLRRVMRGGMDTATEGLRAEVMRLRSHG